MVAGNRRRTCLESNHQAYHLLRVVLHEVRDRLPMEKSGKMKITAYLLFGLSLFITQVPRKA
jgi:uncharacterized protein (DUF2267 family)